MKIDFQHKQSAHCENGATSNLLRYYGIDLSEPMVFGIGAGIFFSYLPFVKVNKIPITTFRPLPGLIFKRVSKSLGILIERKKFRNKDKAMSELDFLLKKGTPVGMLVGVFYLPYFPPEYRFHFNAHNIVVFGKEDGRYLVSDPVGEKTESLSYDELKKVRFAKGTYPPKGRMYSVSKVPASYDLEKAVRKGIHKACKHMLTIPLPMFGVRGIRYLAAKLRKWPDKLGPKMAGLYLGQVIRMLEEIGTGGAGFRFMYAAFLQEAAKLLKDDSLNGLSIEMTAVGDKWREFAYLAARTFKKRGKDISSYDDLANLLCEIADIEEGIFSRLSKISK